MIDGLEADVVTLALAADIDAIAEARASCCRQLASSACPTTAAPTPRRSSSWCARAIPRASRTGAISSSRACRCITPNPKTSGGARWNYLAAWAWATRAVDGDDAKAQRVRRPALRQRAGARHRRARLDHDLRRSAASATCCWRGRTRPSWRIERARRRTSSRSSCRRSQHPGRAAGRAWSTRSRQRAARARWRRPTSNTSTAMSGSGVSGEDNHYRPPRA